MNTRAIVGCVLSCALSGFPTQCLAENSLLLAADTPSATVDQSSSRRNFLRLPELDYVFRVDAHCDESLEPQSLLVSVADTRKSFDANVLADGEAIEFSLKIPASQIAPVAINDFCTADDERHEYSDDRIAIPAALSAQASLRCASESAEQTVYASTPLDVEIVCRSEEEEETVAED